MILTIFFNLKYAVCGHVCLLVYLNIENYKRYVGQNSCILIKVSPLYLVGSFIVLLFLGKPYKVGCIFVAVFTLQCVHVLFEY